MKNFNIRLEEVEDQISELEDRTEKHNQLNSNRRKI